MKKTMQLDKYFNQENTLPDKVKDLIKKQFVEREKIDFYAYVDLDESLNLVNRWIVLSNLKVYIVAKVNDLSYVISNVFSINELTEVKELNSISCQSLFFLKSNDSIPLGSIHFTKRQSVVMNTLGYLLKEKIKNKQAEVCDWNADEIYQTGIIKSVHDVQNNIHHHESTILWRLLGYLKPYKKELVIGTTGAVLTTLISLVPAYISGYLIDHVVRPFQDNKLDLNEALHLGWILLGCSFLVYLLRDFFHWLRLSKMSVLGEYVAKDLRMELYQHMQSLDIDFFSSKSTGSLISRVSSDTDRIWDFIAFGVVEVGIAIITLLSLGIVLVFLDPLLGTIMILPVPILLYSIFIHGERMKTLFLKAWRKWSDVTSVISDTIPGIMVVKAFIAEKREIKRFNETNQRAIKEFENIHKVWTGFWPLLMLGVHVIIMSVWIIAIPRLISNPHDSQHLTAGTFVSFLLYMTMFIAPIEVIGQVARMLNRALSSAYRIFEILDTRPTLPKTPKGIQLDKIHGRVQFEDVVFSYDGIRNVVKGINFEVNPGEMIGLVGESGGGKSTITKLLARFYDVNSGAILVDGVNIKDMDLPLYRSKIAMVMQDPYLFHGTIYENIAYGKPDASMEDILRASRIANAHDFIGKLPYGYDTIVGERGHTLSGGERQRVSIARAVLINPSILILDEATSAVDTNTERKIQEALDRIVEGRTVFAVAHRLSTLRKANRIFVIENGLVKEMGTHQDLLENETGTYRKLHKMQQQMSEFFAI